jgi:hypothetical protein
VPSQIDLTVNSLADSGSGTLRAAIATADAGSHSDQFTIGFNVKGTIDLQTPLPDLNNSIAIQGPGASSLTIMRDSAFVFTSPIITVDAGQTASVSGLTVANGNNLIGNGGGIANFGVLTVSGCTLSGNSAETGGGILNDGTLTVSASAISGNSAAGNVGGGIFNNGTLTVSASAISGNSAGDGGGIYNFGGPVTIQQNSTLSGNTAASGGGILNGNGGTLTVRDSTLSGNSATGFDFGGHHFVGRGGGIDNSGVVTIQDSTLSGNTAEDGGGIYNQGTLDVRGSTLKGNTASDSGGGLYNLGTATVQESTLSGNSAGSDGGGIFNGAAATLAIDDSVVLHNVALVGADLYNLGKATVNDSTVGIIGP